MSSPSLPSPRTATTDAWRNRDLFQNLAGGGQRFSEDGLTGFEIVRHAVQVALREREQFLKGAGVLHDAEHRTIRAMTAHAAKAPFAMAAIEIDLAHDAPSDQARVIGGHHVAHELMAGRSAEIVVAALQFQIGVADAGEDQADQSKAGRPLGYGDVANGDFAVFQMHAEHSVLFSPAMLEASCSWSVSTSIAARFSALTKSSTRARFAVDCWKPRSIFPLWNRRR